MTMLHIYQATAHASIINSMGKEIVAIAAVLQSQNDKSSPYSIVVVHLRRVQGLVETAKHYRQGFIFQIPIMWRSGGSSTPDRPLLIAKKMKMHNKRQEEAFLRRLF